MFPILKESLTVQMVRMVLEDMVEHDPDNWVFNLEGPSGPSPTKIMATITVPPWHGKRADYFDTKDRKKYIIDTCKDLRRRAEDPETHVRNIDELLSSILECHIYVRGMPPGSFENNFALRAHGILNRLPVRPLKLAEAPANLDRRYFWDDESPRSERPPEQMECGTWCSLRVAASLSVTLIKMTLYIVVAGLDTFGELLQDYPDMLAELLETSSDLTSQCSSSAEYQLWYIVRSALWSSWQRSSMLYYYALLSDGLERGFSGSQWGRIDHLRSSVPNPNLSLHQMLSLYAADGKSQYMCSWAFELLRTEPVCLGMDFRIFHQRYLQLWSNTTARCKKGSPVPCAGNSPNKCWRFRGMVIKDQSAHNTGCGERCRKLPWDETSYRNTSGARAVSIESTGSGMKDYYLKYCSVSEKTLAISHVWSHGQGGRPDVGVNQCLHRRYVKIAEQLGCTSYWWDSACIPEDHALRLEAIQNINQTFARSKVTLVCDKDLMGIDIADLTITTEESILATVLVCDWNLRAWTFLESVKGRSNIHLLCKDNRTIPFVQIVRDIFEAGSIDLAILSFSVPHMFPPSKNESQVGFTPYMTTEQSGQVLSYRPASRKGDDIVIWSLLSNEESCDSPEGLWRTKVRESIGYFVHTGFLMSSAPRLPMKGLSWAPSTPYFEPLREDKSRQVPSFRAFSSSDTWPGKVTDQGLLAAWHVYQFDTSNVTTRGSQTSVVNDDQIVVLEEIVSLYLQGCPWGALLLPVSNVSTFERGRDTSTRYRGQIRGRLVAVIGSTNSTKPSEEAAKDRSWMWKSVFEWNEKVCLPKFTEVHDFLIE